MYESSRVIPAFVTIGGQSRSLNGLNVHLVKDSKDASGSHRYSFLFTCSWTLYFNETRVYAKGIKDRFSHAIQSFALVLEFCSIYLINLVFLTKFFEL